MKCPKCGYLGFDHVDRCRNCGYEFSLSSTPEGFELPLKTSTSAEAPRPLDDLSFLDEAMSARPGRGGREEGPASMRVRRADARHSSEEPASEELPLFGMPIPDDLPLITKPAPPRQPLAVRRATPEVARLRTTGGRTGALDFDRWERPAVAPAPMAPDDADSASEAGQEDAPVGARFVAVAADLLILAAIDAVVVYFTMQICGIGRDELALLPKAPLLAFLLVQNGGYLVAFTAGGQTLGKLAAGIKVVSAEPHSPLDFGRALIRELAWVALAVPAGLGLLTVLSRDRRGIHDRCAGTRVVRA
jgi:uncharacterized RDD family membrane protein YckC